VAATVLHSVRVGVTSLEMAPSSIVAVRLPEPELTLLERLVVAEERTRADVIRRALRAYAEKLGVTVAKGKLSK
jgi:hypothetical protein